MKNALIKNSDYIRILKDIKERVRNSQIKAAVRVNSELILMYWNLGEAIVQKQKETKWGDGFVEQLSKDLIEEFPEMKGFSLSNLKYIRQWYSFYSNSSINSQQLVSQISGKLKLPQPVEQFKFNPEIQKSQQLVSQISKQHREKNKSQFRQQAVAQNKFEIKDILSLVPWGHHIQIITKCQDIDPALFYILNTIENNWSRSILIDQIETKLFERQGKAITNFKLTLPQPQSDLANELLKNPYTLDFIRLSGKSKEKDLESSMLDNISKFLMELGYGFAFLGKQKLLIVGGDDFYVDLVFYHTRLHCYFLVELKVDEFKPEYAGKLNFYLNAFNEQVKSPNDNPTIGLMLCKKSNKIVAEYSLMNINNPIGISNYKLTEKLPMDIKKQLPSVKDIEDRIELNKK
ncbi:MAG: DUF1016 domain-containing protein [Ignavibacteriae bacterium]|nr:DUF1016 domain-containing protein [Ignavibacteriota bacterium]